GAVEDRARIRFLRFMLEHQNNLAVRIDTAVIVVAEARCADAITCEYQGRTDFDVIMKAADKIRCAPLSCFRRALQLQETRSAIASIFDQGHGLQIRGSANRRLKSRLGEFGRHPLSCRIIAGLQGQTALQGIGSQKIKIRFEIHGAQMLKSRTFRGRYVGTGCVGRENNQQEGGERTEGLQFHDVSPVIITARRRSNGGAGRFGLRISSLRVFIVFGCIATQYYKERTCELSRYRYYSPSRSAPRPPPRRRLR